MLKSLLRPETPLCKQRIGDTDVPHYDLKDWTKWGPREDGELEGDAELETAEVQCAPGHCLGCSFRSAPSIYCHVTTGGIQGFTLIIIHTVVNIVCGMVPLLAQCSAVLQTENAALTVLK